MKSVIMGHFLPSPQPTPQKNTGYHHFMHEYQKSELYGVLFLRYEVRQTEFFVTLGHFLSFDPPNNPKKQNFDKIKKAQKYYCLKIVWYHK